MCVERVPIDVSITGTSSNVEEDGFRSNLQTRISADRFKFRQGSVGQERSRQSDANSEQSIRIASHHVSIAGFLPRSDYREILFIMAFLITVGSDDDMSWTQLFILWSW